MLPLQKAEFRAASPWDRARAYSQVTAQRSLLQVRGRPGPGPRPGRAPGLRRQCPHPPAPVLQDTASELEVVMEKQKKKVEGEVETEAI